MKYTIEKYNPSWCSYIPVLIKALRLTRKRLPVLELGAGVFSTPLLHMLCCDQNRRLVTYDNDSMFVDMNSKFANDFHQIFLIDDWDKADIENEYWGVVLVDHKPAGRRVEEIKRLRNKADFLIIHDSEERQSHHYHYDQIYPLFKFRYNYKKRYRYAHTTVLSNVVDLSILSNP